PFAPLRNWVVGAFLDAGYVFASNRPDNHVNRGIVTAPRTGELTVSYAAAYVRHDASEREPLALELALQIGPAATALVAGEPQPGGDASRFAGPNVWQHLGRANVGGRIPRAGTELSAGLFNTPIGYWSFWPKDNWSYSTPWHLNAVPYVLMGGRIVQPAGERVMLHAWIVNGYQTYADANDVPSYMFGLTVAPTASLSLGHFDYFGPEDVDIAARSWRWLSDTWLFFERDRFGIAGVFDAMRERLTHVPGQPVALQLAGEVSARVRLLDAREGRVKWYLAGRGEAFWDRDGRMFGVRQLLGSGLVGTDLRLWDYLLVRLEYRYDRTDNQQGFFYRKSAVRDDDTGLGREQHAVYFVLTGMFEHWFAARPKRRQSRATRSAIARPPERVGAVTLTTKPPPASRTSTCAPATASGSDALVIAPAS
ncbi:MAG TPA: outer membrane beta-barrel protein, partial [Nannocystaceae bacterium]|nr:outer membrane beta-barrel protein [Nannocystaceae bacterium]